MANLRRLEELTALMCTDPRDDTPVEVCADLLEQADDPRAHYLRAQLRLRAQPEDPALLEALRRSFPVDTQPWVRRLEQSGVVQCNLTGLASAWWGGELPGREAQGTYTRFDHAALPKLPLAELTGTFQYIRRAPLPDGCDPVGSVDAAAWRVVLDTLADGGVLIPPALRAFMLDRSLQAAIPAPTSNYFISANDDDREINAKGLPQIGNTGALFLPVFSDQQCCVRWGVWLDASGGPYAPIISANIDFDASEEGDGYPVYTDFEFAAPDFESFIYRTWIEGRIWYACHYDETLRDLTDFERRYVGD